MLVTDADRLSERLRSNNTTLRKLLEDYAAGESVNTSGVNTSGVNTSEFMAACRENGVDAQQAIDALTNLIRG